ncbi:lipoprotein BUG3 [Streptococcus parasanguinis]|uniref:lipoprotein BUG3 n=1 Tax=Streptococcus parasanguinis TaxID=1318 RepID=UPI001D083F78|nr:lipoprotein BUG3 [Streptococcus parasanguinis]MCB6704370.1 lipoprotein BUG3 [Streptococcus parasanguinis]MCB6739007.1 lipoprotein BUG3 [Streptococcus parasanguinis]MCB7401230.1 lipoprotein BUG3 [Streptococcus parasanguinis]
MIKQTAFKLITTLALLASIGGCTIKSKEETKPAPIATPSTTKEDKEATKQKQIAYLKEHEKEIVDFVKSKSSKVESVQIYWDETQWIDDGNGTPQGGDEVIEIFGTVNQLEDSGWRVDVVFDSDQKMTFSMGYHISIKGDYIE